VLIKEARRRRRHRYLVIGVAAVVMLAGVAGLAAGLTSAGGHSPARTGLRRVAQHAPGTVRIPGWAGRLGGEVAYKCGDSICLMRPDGTGLRTVTATFPEWDPAWSPDGRRLAFRGYYGPGDGQYDLYAVGANGCHLTRLTRQVNGTSPAWSPGGQEIAFAFAAGGIAVINADGSGLRHLISGTSRFGYDSPAWSAANRIAFVQTRTGGSQGQIYRMSPDGSRVAPLIHGAPGFAQPSWSPDGHAMAFVAVTVPLQFAGVIEVANADGTGRRRVSPPTWTSYSPTWTPGGKIVFLRKTDALTRHTAAMISAYIVNADGSGLRLLYPDLGSAPQIAWGPTALPAASCL